MVLTNVCPDRVGGLDWVEMLPSKVSVFGSRFEESQHEYFVGKFVEAYVHADAPSRSQQNTWHLAQVTDMTATQIKIHFDGWSRAYDQWVDVSHPDHTQVRRSKSTECQCTYCV